MNPRVKYIGAAAFAIIFSAVTILISCQSREQRKALTCTKLEVTFRDSLRFISEADVKSCLDKKYGTYIGQCLDSVRLYEIEDILEATSAVKSCEAWISRDGILKVSITQREPAVRFQKGNIGFYADDRGYIFPLHKSYTAPVPVIEGRIPLSEGADYRGEAAKEEERIWIKGVLNLFDRINSDRKMSASIESVKVRDNGDLVLRFKGRKESFIFGTPDNLDEKFRKMAKYDGWILPSKGEGFYKSVNLKYNKQIICRKDI